MTSSVLILTQEFDLTADPVVEALAEREARVTRVDLSYFPRTMTLTDDGGRRVLRHGDRELDLDRLSGVWYRRPTAFDFGPTKGRVRLTFSGGVGMPSVALLEWSETKAPSIGCPRNRMAP